MPNNNRRLFSILLLAVLVAGTFFVYAPGLNGPFVFDDRNNILENPLIRLNVVDAESLRDAAFSRGNSTYPHRGLARVTFALNYYFAGRQFDAFAFKLTNVVIHVSNGLLVYWLSVLLLRRRAGARGASPSYDREGALECCVPILVATLWMLHPIQLTAVLYVVQRMTSMAAFFVLLGLVVFAIGRNRLDSGRRHGLTLMFSGIAGGVGLGFLCKQNAVLLPFFAFMLELFFFRASALPETERRRLYGFYALTVALPAVLAVAGLVIAWDAVAEAYLQRSFTPWERLLTQSRVLFLYLGLLLFPHIRGFSLFHDDIALSTGLLEPWTTLASVLAWAVLAGLALWGVRRRAMWSFALLWYLIGHSVESSVVGLELVFEHRNYLPSYGILLAAGYYLVRFLERMEGSRRLAYPVVGLLVLVLAFTSYTRAGIWGDRITLQMFAAKNRPDSYRTMTGAGILSIVGRSDARDIYATFSQAAAARESTIIPLVDMAKIAAGLRGLVEDDDGAAATSTPLPDDAELLRQPPVMSVAYLTAVESAIDREISHRLRAHPVSAETAYALRRLRICIVEEPTDVCLPLAGKLKKWYDIALANERMAGSVRGMICLDYAEYHEARGELDLAVRRMREAISMSPRNLSYPFTLAKFHIRHRQWEEADEIINRLETNPPWSGFGSRHVSWLREQFEIRMETTGVEAH